MTLSPLFKSLWLRSWLSRAPETLQHDRGGVGLSGGDIALVYESYPPALATKSGGVFAAIGVLLPAFPAIARSVNGIGLFNIADNVPGIGDDNVAAAAAIA